MQQEPTSSGSPGSERPVLPRLAAGQNGADSELLDRYGRLVWSLARKVCGDVGDAEDAVQEIFIELWKHADAYRPEIASETTFVATIARRRLIDRLRRRERRPALWPLDEAEPASALDLHERTANRLEIESVTTSLRQLRPEQRRLLGLALFEGLTHAEIAAATGKPLGSVKTLIRRGLGQIRSRITTGQGTAGATPETPPERPPRTPQEPGQLTGRAPSRRRPGARTPMSRRRASTPATR